MKATQQVGDPSAPTGKRQYRARRREGTAVETEPLNLRVNGDLKRWLDTESARRGRSTNSQVERWLTWVQEQVEAGHDLDPEPNP